MQKVGVKILEEEEQTMHAPEPNHGKTAAVDKGWWAVEGEDRRLSELRIGCESVQQLT